MRRSFLLILSLVLGSLSSLFAIECRIEEGGEVIYSDLSRFMCNHLMGTVMNDLDLERNPKYRGSIDESRFVIPVDLFTQEKRADEKSLDELARERCRLEDEGKPYVAIIPVVLCDFAKGKVIESATSASPILRAVKRKLRTQELGKAGNGLVECRLEDEGELIYGDLSRFLCTHLEGTAMDDKLLPINHDYDGSIYSSRFIDKHPLALVNCQRREKDEIINVKISRFMCTKRGGIFLEFHKIPQKLLKEPKPIEKGPSYEGINSSNNIINIQF